MKCIICKHGHTQPGKMTSTLDRGDTTIIVKEVPADICDNCGEGYLSQEISAQLLKQAEEAVKAGIQVDVRKYKEAA
jgi:YgiT-type zinc finger domain-containing protein